MGYLGQVLKAFTCHESPNVSGDTNPVFYLLKVSPVDGHACVSSS